MRKQCSWNRRRRRMKRGIVFVSTELAKQMAADGEGATKLLEVRVINCRSKVNARLLAKSVITSNLVKTALYGSDANWGRILCALGYSGAEFQPEDITVTICAGDREMVLVKDGVAADYSEEVATQLLRQEKVTFICDMKEGTAEAVAWGCDLTHEYVTINGDYRS